jgi:hypothetical protein
MAPMIAYSQLVDGLRSRIDTQTRALTEIAQALTAEAERRQRADQASCIDALREQVTLRARWCQEAEERARRAFRTDKPKTSLAKAVGTGLGVWLTRGSNPVLWGMVVLKRELDKTAPFGNVVATVGPGGIPNELDVVSLSRLARERDTSEAEATKAMEAKGYRVVEPQSLLTALRRLKGDVLGGAVVLPVGGEQLQTYLAPAGLKAGGTGLPPPTVVAPARRFRFLPSGQGAPSTASDSTPPS